jgi:hypothetical protein
MLEANPNQPIPEPLRDVQRMWREMQITLVAFGHPAIQDLLTHFAQTHANGGATFHCFHLSEHPVLDWYASRNRLTDYDFFGDFLTHPTVTTSLPDLHIGKPLPNGIEVELGSSFTLDGELAETLVNGGAYEKFRGSGAQAKQIGRAFCESLYGDRFEEVQIYKSWTAWSSWFGDVAWDGTCFGLDKRSRYLWMLCVTDED